MKVFVYERLEDGVWKHWFIRQCDYRRAMLWIGKLDDRDFRRIRRVRTQEEFDNIIAQGANLHMNRDIDVWKSEWVS